MTSPREEAARAYHDALVGVARRHIDRAPEHSVDPWLLEELITLADVARRLAEGGEGFDALSARLSARRAALPSLDTLHPPALVRLFGQQRRWHESTLRGRQRSTRRPGQLQRLLQACDAIVEQAEARFPEEASAPVLHARLPRMRALRKQLARDLDATREARERITRASLSTLLREACAPLEREATLMLASATPSPEARRAARRWLDRAYELETQWLLFAAAASIERPWRPWRRLQCLSARVRREVLMPSMESETS